MSTRMLTVVLSTVLVLGCAKEQVRPSRGPFTATSSFVKSCALVAYPAGGPSYTVETWDEREGADGGCFAADAPGRGYTDLRGRLLVSVCDIDRCIVVPEDSDGQAEIAKLKATWKVERPKSSGFDDATPQGRKEK